MSKFMIVPFDLLDSDGDQMVILSDYKYWANCQDELETWCAKNNARFAGMTVTMDKLTLITFCLRWS